MNSAHKNQRIAPGVSIVHWMSNHAHFLALYLSLRENRGAQLLGPNGLWYSPDQLHMTVLAVTRTDYGTTMPLSRKAVNPGAEELFRSLQDLGDLNIRLERMVLSEEGQLSVDGQVDDPETAKRFERLYELADELIPLAESRGEPSGSMKLHVNVGYMQTNDRVKSLTEELPEPIRIQVDSLSCVHYLNRTLDLRHIQGIAHFHLSCQKQGIAPHLNVLDHIGLL